MGKKVLNCIKTCGVQNSLKYLIQIFWQNPNQKNRLNQKRETMNVFNIKIIATFNKNDDAKVNRINYYKFIRNIFFFEYAHFTAEII